MIDNEKMAQIKGFGGNYWITETGKVWSASRPKQGVSSKGRWLAPWLSQYGYKEVKLRKDEKYHRFRVHRLVAEHFVANPYSLNSVNHINGDKLDNRAENLEWCTIAQNTAHGHKIGLYAEKYKKPAWNKGLKGIKTKNDILKNTTNP